MELLSFFEYGFIRNAFLAAFLMSVTCGIIGTYIGARRMVFISGGITHASFGGVGIGYYFGWPPLAGAAVVAILAALITLAVLFTRNDLFFALVILWAFFGILIKRLAVDSPPSRAIIATLGASMAVIAVVLLLRIPRWLNP